ncbi:MAG: aminoacyl-tRNA hydrolase [Mailhella sp.]|nr:aminoacyl-tRNA hydrolase [Mailhella sp.]
MDLNGIIVGLGNPGTKYQGTRHNIGFMAVQMLLEEVERGNGRRPEQLSGAKFNALLWRIQIPGGGTWLVAEPQTFMNLSGDAVQPIMAYYKLKPEQLLVIHDELDLEPGRLKLKKGGGAAGHNGIKSIQQRLRTPDFYRLRVGVGKPLDREQVTSWVLGHFFGPDKDAVEKSFPDIIDAVIRFTVDGPERAINVANTRKKA